MGNVMQLRAFSICRTCSELYPSNRGCPSCDGDELAAFEVLAATDEARGVSTATEGPVREMAPPPLPPGMRAPWYERSGFAALSLSLVAGAVLLVVLTQAA
jgi:hypothetical protein